MITHTLRCSHCQSENLIKNGHAKNGKQCFRCKDCNKCGRENPGSNAYSEPDKAMILAAYQERSSIHGLRRVFGVSRNTVSGWLKKANQLLLLSMTLVPPQVGDVLELDELWSFVLRRKNKRWVWLALCRRTRQVVAYAIGTRGQETCQVLWDRVPDGYKTGLLYTDFWDAYVNVLPAQQHRATGKGEGQTCHPNKASC